MSNHYEFMVQELDAVRLGLDILHTERNDLITERDQLRHDLAQTRERLDYHMRRASIMASAGS